jgi:hypothetical protein
MPNANRLTVGIMAIVAQDEGRRISLRTFYVSYWRSWPTPPKNS